MAIDLSQFQAVFFDEAGEHLAIIGACLGNLDPEQPASEAVAEAYRCAHSIKGASATFGFDGMSELARALCDLLDRVRQRRIGLDQPIIAASRDAHAFLCAQLAALRSGVPPADSALNGILNRLRAAGDEEWRKEGSGQGPDADTGESGSDAPGPAERLVAALHDTAARIQTMLARMEALSREHAALVSQTTATVRQFEQQMRAALDTGAVLGNGGRIPRIADGANPQRRKSAKIAAIRPVLRACGAPVPKVKEAVTRRLSLEQEWEEL